MTVQPLTPRPSTDVATLRRYGATQILAIQGDLDAVSAPAMRPLVARAWEPGVERVAVDMSRCTFMDSAGVALIAALIRRNSGARAATGPTGDVLILEPAPRVRRTLEITGLLALVTVVDCDGTDGGCPGPPLP